MNILRDLLCSCFTKSGVALALATALFMKRRRCPTAHRAVATAKIPFMKRRRCPTAHKAVATARNFFAPVVTESGVALALATALHINL